MGLLNKVRGAFNGLFGPRAGFRVRAAGYRKKRVGLVTAMHSEWMWRKTRKAFIKKQYKCQMCGGTKDLQVHHIRPWHLFPDLRFNQDNLVTLCQPDHFRHGHWSNWKDYNPDILKLSRIAQSLNTSVRWKGRDVSTCKNSLESPYMVKDQANGT